MAKTKKKPIESKAVKGIREDPALYEQIIKWWNRSKDYINDKNIFNEAETYQGLYDNEPWVALDMKRPEHLTKMRVPIACDVIETGLSVATARPPMPEIEPELKEEKLAIIVPFLAQLQLEEKEFLQIMENIATKYSHGLQKEMVKCWRKSNMQNILRTVFREKGIKGTEFLIIEKDKKTDTIKNEVCGMYNIFPTPGLHSIQEHNKDPFIYAPIRTANKAKEEFGLEEIEQGALRSDSEAIKELHKDHGMRAVSGKPEQMGSNSRRDLTGHKSASDDSVIILKCFMAANQEDIEEYEDKDYVIERESGEIAVDTDKEEVQKTPVIKTRQKFPSGYKCVTIIYGHQDWIVDEYDCAYAPNGTPQPPVVRMAGYLPNKSFWGISEIKQIESLIGQICIVVSNLADVIRKAGGAPLVKAKGGGRVDATNDVDLNPMYAMPGDIWEEVVSNSLRWLQPPSVGFDAKWFLEWMMMIIDRVTHLSDAMRGFNQYARDSGVKIRELRNAALGTFGPKLDEVVEFCVEIFRLWAWIYMNMFPLKKVVLQKEEDELGETNFNQFIPHMGKFYDFFIDVSGKSLIPDDPMAQFEEALSLYNLGMQRTGFPLIPPEVLVDLAPNIEEKHRIKKWLAEQQSQQQTEAQKQEVAKQFEALVRQTGQIPETSSEEDQVFMQMSQMIQQVPELLMTPLFQGLPQRLKLSLISTIVNQGAVNQQQGGNNAQPAKV